MAITGSPAVIIQEEDLSSYVSADSVTTGAVVGNFEWGPVESITKISSEGKLINFFGKPHDWNYKDWFTARNYLNYSSSLAVIRVVSDDSTNASDNGAEILLKNYNLYEFKVGDIISAGTKILARYPGNLGNRIRVAILNKLGLEEQEAAIEDDEEVTINGVTAYISRPLNDDEVAVAVYLDNEVQEYGIFSIEDGSTDVTGYGNYVFKYFNNNSNWIYLIEKNIPFTDEFGASIAVNIDVTLSGGYSAEETLSLPSYMKGWDLFANEETEETEVQLLMQGGGDIEVGNYIIDLAENRKDCLACVSPMIDEVVNVLTPVDNIVKGSGATYHSSSYAFSTFSSK